MIRIERAPMLALLMTLVAGSAAAHSYMPPPRAHHSMVYDASRKVVLMGFGSTPLDGGRHFRFFHDLWAYDACGWQPVGDTGDSSSGVGFAWDSKRRRLVGFGGFDGRASVSAMRSFDGAAWTSLPVPEGVSAAEAGFVYDRARDRLVAFGGSGPAGLWDQTWEFDGRRWTRADAAGPPARQAHVMVYDERRKRTVLFGGMAAGPPGQRPPSLGDTWEYDGKTWVERKVDGPPARASAGAAYDSKRGMVIVFAGMGRDGFLGDTWGWDGKAWRKLAESGPEPRAMGYLAYDAARDRVVLFGGRKGWPDGDLNDTWEWDGERWEPARPLDCW